jgi:hypothetical protein
MNTRSRLLSLSAGLCGLLAVAADPFSEMAYLEVQPVSGDMKLVVGSPILP